MALSTHASESFFLCEHVAVKEFSLRVAAAGSSQSFSIVCERKEDLIALRSQLFHELNAARATLGKPAIDVVAGLSMYTLDSLAENFCASFANNPPRVLGESRVASFKQPYLDVVTQEKLAKLILVQLGYRGSDAAPLAKQLLTLCDVEWPPDATFFDLLLETQSLENERTIKELTDASLRMMLATYQGAQKILSRFSRLQRLVLDYLEDGFLDHLGEKRARTSGFEDFIYPRRFLQSEILWVAAPEYLQEARAPEEPEPPVATALDPDAEPTYRPGNYQARFVDAFLKAISLSQDLLSQDLPAIVHMRTPVRTNLHPRAELARTHVSYFFTNDAHKVYAELKEWIQPAQVDTSKAGIAEKLEDKGEADPETASASASASESGLSTESFADGGTGAADTFVLLADFDPGAFRTLTSDASGSYAFTDKDVRLAHLHAPEDFEDPDSVAAQIVAQVHAHRASFEELHGIMLEDFTFIADLASRYGLSPSRLRPNPSELFERMVANESFNLGKLHPIEGVDRALSFLATPALPARIVAVGPAHAPTAPSFNVKVLNDAFYLLKKKGVNVDLLASDATYRGFWSNLVRKGIPLEFWLMQFEDTERFPQYLAPAIDSRVGARHPRRAFRHATTIDEALGTAHVYSVPDWHALFVWKTDAKGTPTVSVTEFEAFVQCPFSFFLGHVLDLDEETTELTRGNVRDAGTRMHRAAEVLLSRLRMVFPDASLSSAVPFLGRLAGTLRDESFFLSTSKDVWRAGFQACARAPDAALTDDGRVLLRQGLEEILDAIFSDDVPSRAHADADSIADTVAALNALRPSRTSLARERFERGITREVIKRTFRRLVETEWARAQEPEVAGNKTLAFVEHTISFTLAGLHVTGRIDRIDATPGGFEILDYKTSKIPKTERSLVLFPDDFLPRTQLSVQGALYSYAWAERAHALAEGDDAPLAVRSFGLYRLKNLAPEANAFLRREFDPPLVAGDALHRRIGDTYSAYARKLLMGDFSPLPVDAENCNACAFVLLCRRAHTPHPTPVPSTVPSATEAD